MPVDPGAGVAAGAGAGVVAAAADATKMTKAGAMSLPAPRASNNHVLAKRPNLKSDVMSVGPFDQLRTGIPHRRSRGKKTRKLNNLCQNSSTTSWVQWALLPILMSVMTMKRGRLFSKSKARTPDC